MRTPTNASKRTAESVLATGLIAYPGDAAQAALWLRLSKIVDHETGLPELLLEFEKLKDFAVDLAAEYCGNLSPAAKAGITQRLNRARAALAKHDIT